MLFFRKRRNNSTDRTIWFSPTIVRLQLELGGKNMALRNLQFLVRYNVFAAGIAQCMLVTVNAHAF